MYCQNCGFQMERNAKYCGACGKAVRGYEQDFEPEHQNKKKMLIIILAIGLAILVTGIVLFVYSSQVIK